MKEEAREFSPMTGTFPNAESILCKDCIFRDKTQIKIGKRTINVGVTKASCDIFKDTNWKPMDILFHGANCEYYKKDNEE